MERHYLNYKPVDAFSIDLPEDEEHSVGEKWTVSVNMGNGIGRYIIAQTSSGPRLDWLASMELRKEDERRMEDNFKERWGLMDAVVEATVLRAVQSGRNTDLFVRVVNRSRAYLSSVGIQITVYDANGDFSAHGSRAEYDIPPGEERVARYWFYEVAASRVSTWRLTLEDVVVLGPSGEGPTKARQYFAFRESKEE